MGVTRGFVVGVLLAFGLFCLSSQGAAAANFSLDVNNAVLDLGNLHGLKAVDSTATPPDPPATLRGTVNRGQINVPKANFVFPTKTTEVMSGLEAAIDLYANRDIKGTFNVGTGEMTLNFSLKAVVVALGQTCVLNPIDVTISSRYGQPYLGVPFADGTGGAGALDGRWDDLPAPTGGTVCQVVSSLITGPGGIWMSHNVSAPLKCADDPAHPGCDNSNPCANGPSSDCCARRPAFQFCPRQGGNPKLTLSVSPRVRRVRSGGVAKFTIKARNRGTAKATGVRICARAPRKRATAPKCQRVSIARGRTLRRKFKIKLNRKAKGKVPVSFRLTAPGAARRVIKVKIKVRR